MQSSQRIRELFDAAIELPPADRIPFLLKECKGDDQAFAELARLVSAYQQTSDYQSDEEPGPHNANVLGAYEIVRELGHGGMGAVYLARRVDGTFERTVALKVVRPDRRTDGALERFTRERRLLASLTHPGIARLLDAGSSPEGHPYFVMEYVDGLTITEYADRKCLTVPQRIALFMKVCDAVASAHRVPIVHCDLKPGNILVGADGQPRVLDFGIATALTPGGLEAEPPLDPYGSPRYASPEQMRGEPVHTTSDIYSLGVVLFELLTGAPPPVSEVDHPAVPPSSLLPAGGETTALAVDNPAAVAALRGTDVGGLRHALVGDIDAIVTKCLQWRSELRYQSVDALADDLRRYLERRPVAARRATASYVAGRFASRHRWAVSSGVVAALLLAAAVVGLTVLWQKAERARIQSDRRFNDVRELAKSLFAVDDALANVAGSTAARQRVIESASAYLDRLGTDRTIEPDLAIDIAEGHRRVGDMLGNPNLPNLGRRDEALKRYDLAAQILTSHGPDPSSPVAQEATARVETSRADVLQAQQRFDDARAAYERAATIYNSLASSNPGRLDLQRALAGVFRPLGDVYAAQDDAPQALGLYEKARALDLALLAKDPGNAEYVRQLALTQLRVGDVTSSLPNRRTEAVDAYRESLRLIADAVQRSPNRPDLHRDAALAHVKLGRMTLSGDQAAAMAELLQAVSTFRELALRDPHDAGAQRDLLVGLVAYADALSAREPDEARRVVIEARRIAERLTAEPVRDLQAERDLEAVASRLGSPATKPPELKVAAIRDGREVPFNSRTRVPAVGEPLRVRWDGSDQRAEYLLMLGGEGAPKLLERSEVERAGWQITTEGPLPSQTLLLLQLERPLGPSERNALLSQVAQIAGPRRVPAETQIVWPSAEVRTLDANYRARGETPPWVDALRRALSAVPGLTYTGRTFPLDGLR